LLQRILAGIEQGLCSHASEIRQVAKYHKGGIRYVPLASNSVMRGRLKARSRVAGSKDGLFFKKAYPC